MRMVNDTVFIFCKAKGQVPHSTLGSVPSGRMWGAIGEPTWRRAPPQGLALGFNGLWLGSNLALSPGPSVMIPQKTPRWIRHSRWAGLGRECSEGRKVWGGWAGKFREARRPGAQAYTRAVLASRSPCAHTVWLCDPRSATLAGQTGMCSHNQEANDLVRDSHKEARLRMVKEVGIFNKVSINTVSHRGENCSLRGKVKEAEWEWKPRSF